MNEDDLSPEARQLVDLARGSRTPSDEQRERAFQMLMAGLGAPGAAAAGKLGAAKVAGKSSLLWLKWALPALLLATVGVGAYVFHKPPAASAPLTAPSVSVAPPAEPMAPMAAPSAEAAVEPAPSAAPDLSAAPPPKAPSIGKPSSDDLVAELTLLHQALAESRSGNAARALELARQHAQRYPNSRLRIERDAIEVRSLCSLGRAAEARKIADRLKAQAPNSPVSASLQETCVGK